MKTHTSGFKTNIAKIGRDLDSKITYGLDGETIELGAEELNSVTPHYKADILKSVMKQLDIDSNVDIPIGTVVNYQFGVKVGNAYEYLDYGNYIVNKSERQEDLYSYKLTCYDKMLLSMVDYEDLEITYPITIRNYINAICTHLGITFTNANDTFVNYDKEIDSEKYLDENGNSLGYKFRDVLDELAQVTASTICINDDDELEIRYVQEEEHEIKTATGTNIEITDAYNVPIYEDKMSKLSTQETTTQNANLCPPFTDSRWVFSGGASVTNDGYLSIPANSNARAYVDMPWNGSRNCYVKNIIVSGGNIHYNMKYYDANGTQLSDNGHATSNKGENYQDAAYFGGNNQYGDALVQSKKIRITFLFSSYTPNAYVVKDLIISTTDTPYIPFVPDSPSPDYPQEVKTVKGYRNLLNPEWFTAGTTNHVTLTNTNNKIILDGTASAQTNFNTGLKDIPENATSISLNGGTNNVTFVVFFYNNNTYISGKTDDGNGVSVSIPNNANKYAFRISVANGTQLDNYEAKVQLTISNSILPYVPYGTNWIYKKIIGKNLSPINSKTITGTTNATGQVGSINGTVLVKDIPIKNGQKYYISGNFPEQLTDAFKVFLYNGNLIANTHNATYTEIVNGNRGIQSGNNINNITNSDNYEFMAITTGTRATYSASSSVTMEFSQIMVREEGTSATYETYKEKNITLPLNDNEICGIGNYKDELIVDKNGHCWLNKVINKVVLDGSESNWDKGSTYNVYWNSSSIFDNTYIVQNAYSNYFINVVNENITGGGTANNNLQNNQFSFRWGTKDRIYIKTDVVSTLADFKNWLATHNTVVYYVLTESQLIDLNYNVDLTLFEGTNNISNSEDMDMEIKYYTPTITNDVIDEDFFKDVNVDFGKKYGPINSVVLSRSAGADNIYEQDESSVLTNGLCELKISDNQIMNDNDRDTYLQEIFQKLNGLEYYINDYVSTGIMYYDLCDRYFAHIGDNDYSCVMLNDEALVTQGLQENIHTDMPVVSVTEYDKADKTDRKINQTYLIVDKQNGEIEGLVSKTNAMDTTINNNYQEITQKFNGYTPTSRTVEIENSVRTLQTDTYTKTEINTKLVDGSVQKVQTVSGTFDENGMTYEKTNAPTKTTINEVGVNVKDESNRSILFSGYVNENNTEYADYKGQTIVASENIIVRHYFVMPDAHSRIEKYGNGGGMFYV